LLDESVRLQLVSDVPVGVFLSGGIDSSALVGILSRSDVRPSTFSIVFRELDYSEAEFSRAIAQQFRTDHHEITVSQSDFFAAITPAIRAMDLPTIDGINTYFVSQQTRAAGVKVALSGLGGDEVFAGYSTFRTVPRMERFAQTWRRITQPLRNSLARLSLPRTIRVASWPLSPATVREPFIPTFSPGCCSRQSSKTGCCAPMQTEIDPRRKKV
jgi:asparagine synthase (glutamine-hydrolysing)